MPAMQLAVTRYLPGGEGEAAPAVIGIDHEPSGCVAVPFPSAADPFGA